MSLPAAHDMPILDAYPAPGFPGHWYARWPDGERTYPSERAMATAGARIGAAVRFNREALRPLADPGLGDRSASARSAARSPVGGASASGPRTVRTG